MKWVVSPHAMRCVSGLLNGKKWPPLVFYRAFESRKIENRRKPSKQSIFVEWKQVFIPKRLCINFFCMWSSRKENPYCMGHTFKNCNFDFFSSFRVKRISFTLEHTNCVCTCYFRNWFLCIIDHFIEIHSSGTCG